MQSGSFEIGTLLAVVLQDSLSRHPNGHVGYRVDLYPGSLSTRQMICNALQRDIEFRVSVHTIQQMRTPISTVHTALLMEHLLKC